MSNITQTKNYKIGLNVQRAIEDRYKQKGFYVNSHYNSNVIEAPMMKGLYRKYIVPDLLVSRDGITKFVECKYKTSRMSGHFDGYTGYNLKEHNDFLEIQKITGLSIIILFYQENGDMYWNYLDELDKHFSKKFIDRNRSILGWHYPEAFNIIK